MVKLGEVGTIITGNTPKTSDLENYSSKDIAFFKPSDFKDATVTYLRQSEFFISNFAREKARILPPNSVLVTCIGNIGKVGINKQECAFNQQINAIIPNKKCISDYLAYYIVSRKRYLNDIANAPVVPIINKQQFSELEISVPSISEQIKIVERLNKISHILALRKSQLEKLDLLVKSRFIEMFGDPVSNPKGWNVKELLGLGQFKNGINFHFEDAGVEIYCLGVGDFKNKDFLNDAKKLSMVSLSTLPSKEYFLHDNDIVFVRSNGNKALVGRCLAVYPGNTPVIFSGFCIRFRKNDDSILTPYLLHILKCESIRKTITGRGANIQNLNQQILGNVIIPLPPLELQNKFANFVFETDKSKLAIQQSLEKLETLKKSLMQEYFG